MGYCRKDNYQTQPHTHKVWERTDRTRLTCDLLVILTVAWCDDIRQTALSRREVLLSSAACAKPNKLQVRSEGEIKADRYVFIGQTKMQGTI